MVVEASALGPLSILCLTVASQCCHEWLNWARESTQPLDNGIAIQLRQADIEQHDLRLKLLCNVERGFAVLGAAHIVPLHFQQHTDRFTRIGIIVNDQNALRGVAVRWFARC